MEAKIEVVSNKLITLLCLLLIEQNFNEKNWGISWPDQSGFVIIIKF